MSEREFEKFLSRLSRAMGRGSEGREDVTGELRDHFDERLSELLSQGVPRQRAIQDTVNEFGDAANLAEKFDAVSRTTRRRLIMRFATGSLATTVAALMLAMAFWPDVPQAPLVQRAAAGDGAESVSKSRSATKDENNAKTEAILATSRVTADFDATSLTDVLDYIRDILAGGKGKPKLQIHVNKRALNDEGVAFDESTVTIQLADVRADMLLELALRQLDLGYYVDDGIIFVTTQEDLQSRMEIRVYNCRDLVQLPRLRTSPAKPGPGGEAPGGIGGDQPGLGPRGGAQLEKPAPTLRKARHYLAQFGGGGGGLGGGGAGVGGLAPEPPRTPEQELIVIIEETIDPDSWQNNGGPGSISEYRGLLVISNTTQAHRRIERFLEILRKAVTDEPPVKTDKANAGQRLDGKN